MTEEIINQESKDDLDTVEIELTYPVANSDVVETTNEPVEFAISFTDVPVGELKNVTQTSQVFSSPEKPIGIDEVIINLPGDDVEHIKKSLANLPNIDIDSSPAVRQWTKALVESRKITPQEGLYDSTINRKNAEFVQAVQSEIGPLGAAQPKFKYNTGSSVSGERAVMRVRSLAGLGTIVQIPLWHSGFWVTLRNPSEGSLLELHRRLAEEKIDFGRRTYGMALSGMSAFVNMYLYEFIMQHVYDTSIIGENVDLQKEIKALDYPLLVWGLALSIYRNGFAYARPCLVDPEKCNYVLRELISISKILWTDSKALTSRQIAHMSKRGGSSMTLDSVHNYQEDFAIGKDRVVELTNDLKMTLSVPSIGKFLQAGQKWVNNITARVDRTFTEFNNEETRNSYITQQAQATSMRQVSHWVKNLIAGDDIIDDEEDIENSLDALSENDKIREVYEAAINSYISDSTVAIIAIPNMTCPVCNKEADINLPRFPRLVPIEVVPAFFILLEPKIQRILTR